MQWQSNGVNYLYDDDRLEVPTMVVLDRGLQQPIGFIHWKPKDKKEKQKSETSLRRVG